MEQKIANQSQNFLEKIDIFGIGINIRLNKQAVHKTKIGGIATLIIIAVLAYLIKLIVDNLQDTQNPFVLFEQRFTAEPERYYLTKDKFIMAFGIQDSKSQHYIDPTVYKATLYIRKTVKTLDPKTNEYISNQQKRPVLIEPCRLDHFSIPEVNKYFTSLKYTKLFCISNQETELFLEGQFDSLHYSTFELVIESCQGADCNPDMNNILKLCRLAVYYVDYSVIPSDISNPFQPLGRQSFWVSGPDLTKVITMTFRNSYLKSDYGLIGQNYQTDKALTFSGDKEQVGPKTNSVLFDCFIQFEKNIDSVYKRSYQKLDKSISQLGGIFNILFTIGAIICRPLSQIELNLKLINRLFQFEDKHLEEIEEKKKNQQKQSREQNSKFLNSKDENLTSLYTQNQEVFQTEYNNALKQNFKSIQKSEVQDNVNTNMANNNNTILNSCIINNNNTNSNVLKSKISQSNTPILKKLQSPNEKIKKAKTTELVRIQENEHEKEEQINEMKKIFSFTKNKISFKGWEYYSNFFKFSYLCKNRKHQLLQKGVEKLYNQIDIFYLIQKMLEIEKLKRLLLNENQIKLFEFIPKPVLTLQDKKLTSLSDKVGILYEEDTDALQKAADAKLAFSQLMNPSQKTSKIDLRLLELLDPHFKSIMKDLGKDMQGDLSALQRPIINIFDSQKHSQSAPRDYLDDDLKVATEDLPTKLYSSDINYSPRRTLNGLYSSNTKPNHTQFINI